MSSSEKESLAPPEAKKCRLSLTLKKKQQKVAEEAGVSSKERFPVISANIIEGTKKCIVPKNTEKLTNWAVRLFNSWFQQRNASCGDKVPESILLSDNHEDLCHWLCVAINKLRKEDGSEYTPRSISQYIAGIQCYITNQKGVPVKLVDPTNRVFQPLHQALDNRYRELHANGVGTRQKQAEIITLDEEE